MIGCLQWLFSDVVSRRLYLYDITVLKIVFGLQLFYLEKKRSKLHVVLLLLDVEILFSNPAVWVSWDVVCH